jgi:hypothetical protein
MRQIAVLPSWSNAAASAVPSPSGTAIRRGSAWAVYWRQTVAELRTRLVPSGKLDDRLIDTFLARCADPAWWTQTIAFTAAAGHVRGE